MKLSVEQFNTRYKMEIIDLSGSHFGEKEVYSFEKWEAIQFFLPFAYEVSSRKIVLKEILFDPLTQTTTEVSEQVKEFYKPEISLLEQVNQVLAKFGNELELKDVSDQYGILLVDLPHKFLEYTYITRRLVVGECYYTVMNCDDIGFIAKEGARAVFTKSEVESDPILRRYYFKDLSSFQDRKREQYP